MEMVASELIETITRHSENTPLLSILEDIQSRYQYLPREALILISEWLDVPLSQLFSVATFYHAFSLLPRGKYTIQVCTGTACHVRGAIQILNRLEALLGIQPGETTPDRMFTLATVNCLGTCALGPVLVAGDEYVGKMTPAKVDRILKSLKRTIIQT
jgi:NADH:ubiquinone oxidoreductase subunit E